MSFISKLLLVLFLAFLSAPTVVCLIEKNTDISLFYNFAEEELHKDIKENNNHLNQTQNTISAYFFQAKSTRVISENLSNHDNVSEEIFSPPPELI